MKIVYSMIFAKGKVYRLTADDPSQPDIPLTYVDVIRNDGTQISHRLFLHEVSDSRDGVITVQGKCFRVICLTVAHAAKLDPTSESLEWVVLAGVWKALKDSHDLRDVIDEYVGKMPKECDASVATATGGAGGAAPSAVTVPGAPASTVTRPALAKYEGTDFDGWLRVVQAWLQDNATLGATPLVSDFLASLTAKDRTLATKQSAGALAISSRLDILKEKAHGVKALQLHNTPGDLFDYRKNEKDTTQDHLAAVSTMRRKLHEELKAHATAISGTASTGVSASAVELPDAFWAWYMVRAYAVDESDAHNLRAMINGHYTTKRVREVLGAYYRSDNAETRNKESSRENTLKGMIESAISVALKAQEVLVAGSLGTVPETRRPKAGTGARCAKTDPTAPKRIANYTTPEKGKRKPATKQRVAVRLLTETLLALVKSNLD